jgi:hypothetical protein
MVIFISCNKSMNALLELMLTLEISLDLLEIGLDLLDLVGCGKIFSNYRSYLCVWLRDSLMSLLCC